MSTSENKRRENEFVQTEGRLREHKKRDQERASTIQEREGRGYVRVTEGGRGQRGDKNSSPALSMVAVLGTQSDLNVDPSLVVLVKRCGGVAIMLPKFRCEINPTGLVWGRYTIQCLTNLLRVMQRPSTA